MNKRKIKSRCFVVVTLGFLFLSSLSYVNSLGKQQGTEMESNMTNNFSVLELWQILLAAGFTEGQINEFLAKV
ncbi:MAG: hypothetical protein DRP02_01020, partial [Candidatus Gerdarchaeota archaeon]